MNLALTPTVAAYRITPTSPTGELQTLERIYADVGDYASTILDSAHRALTRLCRRRLAAIARELSRRGIVAQDLRAAHSNRPKAECISKPDTECIMHNDAASTAPSRGAVSVRSSAPTTPTSSPVAFAPIAAAPSRGAVPFNDEVVVPRCPSPVTAAAASPSSLTTHFAEMSISDLYAHYLAWPERHEARLAAGHEPLDFSYEALIIRELERRTAANCDEQLKIDYCLLSYRNELSNLSQILSLPLEAMHSEECIMPNAASGT